MKLVQKNESIRQAYRRLSDESPRFIQPLRKSAFSRFETMGFPTRRDEDWRFTNVAPIAETDFALAEKPIITDVHRRLISELEPTDAIQLVLVNGSFVAEMSRLDGLPAGVVADGLANALKTHADNIEPRLGQIIEWQQHPFTALNTAFLRDGVYIHIPKGTVVEKPIQLIFLNDAEKPIMSHPRLLVICERESQATIVERHLSLGDGEYFANVVSEFVLDENVHVDHYKVQQESRSAFHIANSQARLKRASNFRSHYISLGGRLVRNEARVHFEDEGCEATINGLYVGTGTQHLDHLTKIDHAKAHCDSHELYKGILSDKAHGVFTGKIYVHQDAQKTDAKQTNQVLLLSDNATINTKPQLEIYADDVKCTHGATVGQLDPNALFYLRSRGIDLESARSLLTYAFANDILERIRVDAIREQLEQYLTTQHFTSVQELKEAL